MLGGGVEDVGEEIEWREAVSTLAGHEVSLMSSAPDPGREEGGAGCFGVHTNSNMGGGGDFRGGDGRSYF